MKKPPAHNRRPYGHAINIEHNNIVYCTFICCRGKKIQNGYKLKNAHTRTNSFMYTFTFSGVDFFMLKEWKSNTRCSVERKCGCDGGSTIASSFPIFLLNKYFDVALVPIRNYLKIITFLGLFFFFWLSRWQLCFSL